ncbi:MAG TPA: YfiR family protein, partial [Gemmatimonadaceae bacterium]|nr:YfiR family protein [Gemmatimonadaceae bacterium]
RQFAGAATIPPWWWMGRARIPLLAIAAACVLTAPAPAAPPADAPAVDSPEPRDPREVKAEMLYNIAKFIKWPESSFAKSDGQLVFTILGDDALAEALAANLSTRTVNGRPVFVRMVRRVQDAAGSQIVYIASSESSRMNEVLRAMEGSPSLTVADSTGFVALGGMVDFADANARIRFEINQARAEHAGLKISAKLLMLARVVDNSP